MMARGILNGKEQMIGQKAETQTENREHESLSVHVVNLIRISILH